MLRTALAGLAVLASVAFPGIAAAQAPGPDSPPPVRPGYQPPRLASGKPDLNGVWTNASSTNLERARNYGDQLVLSDEEMAKIEGETFARNNRQNAPTPKEVQDNWTKIATAGPDTLDECRSGARGASCGYNAGWTDPGDWVMRVNGKGRTSLITYPANGRIPPRVASTTAQRPRVVETSEDSTTRGEADNPEDRSLGERCIMSFGISSGPIMTDQLYNNTYQFVLTDDHLVIWVEMVHDARIIPIGGKHRTDGIRPWMGDSIAWWEGDTLVVETINFNPKQNVRNGGPNMKVTERFTRVSDDRLHYAFDIQDPDTWAERWGGEYEFAGVDGQVYEYACHEGNHGLEGILQGARADDERAAAKKPK
jgi:hypothetical protein